MIGSISCTVQSITDTQLTCTIGLNSAGTYAVLVQVTPNGYSNSNIQFTYTLSISSMSAIQGSYGGGLEITLYGNGFSGLNTSVTICNANCPITNSTGASQVSCKV